MSSLFRNALGLAVLLTPLAAPAIGEAQTHGRTCRTSDTGYLYTIQTPSGDSRQHDLDIYFNQNASAFILLVFDEDDDTVLSTASGLQSGDRFVHGSLRLLPSKTYRIAVGCVVADAAYRLSVRRGEEISLRAPRVLGAHGGLSAEEAVLSLNLESVVLKGKALLEAR